MELGTVIATPDGPTPRKFCFVVKEGVVVGLNKFVKVEVDGNWAYGYVKNVVRMNRYFQKTDAVWEYERGGGLSAAFPTSMWEYSIAEVWVFGYLKEGFLRRPSLPPSPGKVVFDLTDEELRFVLGLDEDGLEIGELEEQNLLVRLNPTRLLQKHLAVLAMSGAGKSNCAKVIVEELLKRNPERGRPAVLIFDVHGEYSDLVRSFPGQVVDVKAENIKINTSELTVWHFREFIPEMTGSQARELAQILDDLKSKKGFFEIWDIINRLRELEGLNKNLRGALEGWLFDLQSLGIFGREDCPRWDSLIFPGRAVVVNMERMTSLTKKQILLTYIVNRIFHLRRRGLVPPIVLVIEEAHTFAPTEAAISKHVLETVAREGRKFHISLVVISQRPVRLSTTLLSQTNTNIILRITNPYDLEHIKKSSEMVTGEMAESISSLAVGEALVVGEAVNVPIFVRIRRVSSPISFEFSLEEAARLYELSLSVGIERTAKEEHSSSLSMTSDGSTCSSAYSSRTGERST